MKVGDKVLILDTASENEYESGSGPGWNMFMEELVGSIGYIGKIHDTTAYVTTRPVPPGKDPGYYEGWTWKLKDLHVIEHNKWRRQECR